MRSYLGPGGHRGTHRFSFRSRDCIGDPEVVGEPGGSPSDPKIAFVAQRSWGEPEGSPLDPGIMTGARRLNPEVLPQILRSLIGTGRLYGNPEVLPQILYTGPEIVWRTVGTVLRLPRQDYYRYLFGFCILPLGSWPLLSSYVVFYFCRKSLTGLEGAGVLGSFDSILRLAIPIPALCLIPISIFCGCATMDMPLFDEGWQGSEVSGDLI
ncbi:hypothetical protein F2Q69_00052822 [Brassica cretica]|uniref:Uncharacterized protein n=1 Tax=Brassica cretica TaxID=69181 RepID=A0A8S9N3X4_BRACR|nr:hypothetical protein F2Q69_00052822 [Brassica cretica]